MFDVIEHVYAPGKLAKRMQPFVKTMEYLLLQPMILAISRKTLWGKVAR